MRVDPGASYLTAEQAASSDWRVVFDAVRAPERRRGVRAWGDPGEVGSLWQMLLATSVIGRTVDDPPFFELHWHMNCTCMTTTCRQA